MKKISKRLLFIGATIFILMNVVAAFHAYKFTHFAPANTVRTADPRQLSLSEKIKTIFTGVSLPKPVARVAKPKNASEIIIKKGDKELNTWLIPAANRTKGVVVLCHGYGGEKTTMMDRAKVFVQLGYDALLIDFSSVGRSNGNNSTIGYNEADEVALIVEHLEQKGYKNIVLMGSSMGAAAIMRAVSIYPMNIRAAIIECPFGTMKKTVVKRFENMGVPPFPMADLLVFWGGALNGFNAFAHNPETYAKGMKVPTLLLYGAKDVNVSMEETQSIFNNLAGPKKLIVYPEAGHESYLNKYADKWRDDVNRFLLQH